ncbi:MAG: DUF1189 family protein [Elusimicrobiaceae bacterium]|nr:DUF1189 family protein [Elusimicrobiaceae bacterium]
MLFVHFKTLFSFKFYHRLAQLSPKYAVGFAGYLFALSVIVVFFFTGAQIKKNLPAFLKNFPQVTFEKGVLTAPQKPVFASIPGTDFKIVFDATAHMPPSAQDLVKDNTVAWVHGNTLYIPSADTLQRQELPNTLNFTSSQETLTKYAPTLSASLRAALFITSLLFLALLLLYEFGLALCVLLFFNIFNHGFYPKMMLLKLAAFLLGPLTTVFWLRLWWNIPLFTLAQLLVCIIYVQQIFNTKAVVLS